MSARTKTAVVEPSATTAASTEKKLFGQVALPGFVYTLVGLVIQAALFVYSIYNAYRIRTYALTEYGMVIHEFDPWFNFRATQYLSKNGWHAFFHWFDYMSWYPLGRPVGTTIYPGLQITAVAIHRALKLLGQPYAMSLNDVCCTIPCWFGSIATIFLALITYEVSRSRTAAVISALFFSIMPAHMMRSVGGGFDNESIAISAMLMTFFFWIRSLRSNDSWPIGIVAGLAYGYMVAAWGGFVFVLNMVAVHAAAQAILDVTQNHYSTRLHRSYSLFYIIGTAIATCVPPVGWMPFKSLEQLFALVVFVVLQVLHFAEPARKKADAEVNSRVAMRIRLRYLLATAGAGLLFVIVLAPGGFFGPLSSRVRALFVPHTRTGNPLVDSVAEHQPATSDAYWQYLHIGCYAWNLGLFLLPWLCGKQQRAMSFLFLYSIIAYFFSLKMARLILLAGPVASALSGILLGRLIHWAIEQFSWSEADTEREALAAEGKDERGRKVIQTKNTDSFDATMKKWQLAYTASRMGRMSIAGLVFVIILFGNQWSSYVEHSERLAQSFANPQIMFKSYQGDRVVMIDDYREAYFWLKKNTPEDARVMAWWDYGYQITGIANRTSIADGNTWNHEHIATLGKCLTSPVKEAHSLIRHLADYVLVWAGGGGDDLAKSPHMARIGNSVYNDICPEDPFCMHFGFKGPNHENPTPMMRKSLLYNLHAHNQKPGVRIDPQYFTEAYTSKHGLVRIFKVTDVSEESKAWLADPKNRVCDAPGSWYCNGQYPPAPEIQALMAKREAFAQLEDFNAKDNNGKKSDYHRKYMQRAAGMGH